MSDPGLETEWYLRDFLFRQGNLDRQNYSPTEIAREMSGTYLRYRAVSAESLADVQRPAIERLILLGVLQKLEPDGNCRLASKLTRLRCDRCLYVSYLSNAEPRRCLRCSAVELHDFPRRK